jgi:Skp family chaperone for outer membrane proteins
MKSFAVALLLTGALTPVIDTAPPRPALAVAYLSLQRILTESADAKKATQQLESLRKTKADEINTAKQALEATRLQLANAGGLFSATRRARLKTEEKRQELALQQQMQQSQTAVQDLQRQLQADLRGKLSAIVTDISRRRGILYVLNQDNAIISAPTVGDLTAEVLERLNGASAQNAPPK